MTESPHFVLLQKDYYKKRTKQHPHNTGRPSLLHLMALWAIDWLDVQAVFQQDLETLLSVDRPKSMRPIPDHLAKYVEAMRDLDQVQEELEKVVNVEQFVDVDTRERVESQVHRASERKDMVLLGMTWSRHKTKPEKGEELSKAPKALIEALTKAKLVETFEAVGRHPSDTPTGPRLKAVSSIDAPRDKKLSYVSFTFMPFAIFF